MNGRTGSHILRQIPRTARNNTSSSSSPQHTASFRLSPSTTHQTSSSSSFTINNNCSTFISRRTLSSSLRNQTHHTIVRSALACEMSSCRYALLLKGEGEEALLRGWDAGVAVEDEDGT
mmetsp:Transcript_30478/g.51999  ORF Transcript_30478/g.51999 Transcript_30478/m.51999 type:complete len:119 (-) Transcript_30478:267-623(-)